MLPLSRGLKQGWQQSRAGQGPEIRQRDGLQSWGTRGDSPAWKWVLLSLWGVETPENMGVSHLLAWVY